MRTPKIVDYLMSKIPSTSWRFCTSELCACLGCVNHFITKEEFEDWRRRHNYCEFCRRIGEKGEIVEGFTKFTKAHSEYLEGEK